MMVKSLESSRSLLIVEDDALIRFNLADFFEDAGFRVSQAEDADEAISILEANSEITVVVSDVRMPGSMDGLKLAHHVRGRYPPTVLVVMSGFERPKAADLPVNSLFMAKPFDFRSLLKRIEHAIGHS